MLIIKDIDINVANRFIETWHRHNNPVPTIQARFAVSLVEYLPAIKTSTLLGVAIIGNPCGRPNDQGIVELRRVAFKPGEVFHKLRRWYPDDDNKPTKDALTLRRIPIVTQTNDMLDHAIEPGFKVPSFFMKVVEKLVKRRMPNKHTIWTYIREGEKGTYLNEAGFRAEHWFTRGGVPKTRFAKSLMEMA